MRRREKGGERKGEGKGKREGAVGGKGRARREIERLRER